MRTGDGVREIVVQSGRAAGVVTQNGERLTADAIVANVDHTTTLQRLLPQNHTNGRKSAPLKPSCSGFILLLGVEKTFPRLAHHNIFFSRDYRHEFQQIFGNGVMPDDPTIYVAITSKTDAGHAPEGCENWFVLVNAPPLSERYDWQQNACLPRQSAGEAADYGFEARGSIRSEQMLTPHDLEQMTGAYRGALYGASPNDRFSAFRRPHNRAKDVKGLYFAGRTTHPGGGVPMVMLSGKVAAGIVMEDFGKGSRPQLKVRAKEEHDKLSQGDSAKCFRNIFAQTVSARKVIG
ncbi:MAG: hypothetical protein U0694_14005 [Anaerolineae bacterium]